MAQERDGESGLDIDLDSLSPESLVDLIRQLEGSRHLDLRKRVQKALVDRLRKQGFTTRRIAALLMANVYGIAKKRAIAREWADALGMTYTEFLKLIGKQRSSGLSVWPEVQLPSHSARPSGAVRPA